MKRKLSNGWGNVWIGLLVFLLMYGGPQPDLQAQCGIKQTITYKQRSGAAARSGYGEYLTSGSGNIYLKNTVSDKKNPDGIVYKYKHYSNEMGGYQTGADPVDVSTYKGSTSYTQNSEIVDSFSANATSTLMSVDGKRSWNWTYKSEWWQRFATNYNAASLAQSKYLRSIGDKVGADDYLAHSYGVGGNASAKNESSPVLGTNGTVSWPGWNWWDDLDVPQINYTTNDVQVPDFGITKDNWTKKGTAFTNQDLVEGVTIAFGGGGSEEHKDEISESVSPSTVYGAAVSAALSADWSIIYGNSVTGEAEINGSAGHIGAKKTNGKVEITLDSADPDKKYEVVYYLTETSEETGTGNANTGSTNGPSRKTIDIAVGQTVPLDATVSVSSLTTPAGIRLKGTQANYSAKIRKTMTISGAFVQEKGGCPCSKLTKNSPGSLEIGVSSIHIAMFLGVTTNGASIGTLELNSDAPVAALNSPTAIELHATDVLSNLVDGKIYYAAPQVLAEVIQTNDYCYAIRFFPWNAGNYLTNEAPLVVYTIQNPDTTPDACRHLRITETRGAQNIVNDFVWSDGDQNWSLTSGNGLRKESLKTVWNSDHTIRTETRDIRDPQSNQLVRRTVQKHQISSNGLLLIEQTEGAGSAAQTATYSYYDNGLVKQVNYPFGNWEYHVYDSTGRETALYSAFMNQGVTTNSSLCRVREFSYTPVTAAGDDGTLVLNSPRLVVEKVLGTEVSRNYSIYLTNEERTIRCQTPGAAWDTTNNLVSITKYVADGAFKGKVASISNPDGTMVIYEYEYDEDGYRITRTYTGAPNEDRTAVIDGTMVEETRGVLGTILSQVTKDIVSDIVIDSRTYSNFDELYRPGRVTFLDGSYQDTTYSCCEVESETDFKGVSTIYGYDLLKRQNSVTKNNISMLFVFDAADHIISTVHQGTNGSQVALNSASYNSAGEQIRATDALGNVTIYTTSTNGSGQRVRTTTYADGNSQIQTAFKEGTLQSLTGTAVYGVSHQYGVEDDGSGISRFYDQEIKLLTNGTSSSEWIKTYLDMAGHKCTISYPDGAAHHSYYNSYGQLWKEVDPDGVATLLAYNAKGEIEYTAIDMNRNDSIDLSGMDCVTRTVRSVATSSIVSGMNIHRLQTYVWSMTNSDAALLVSTIESSTDGNRQWKYGFGLTNASIRICLTNGQCWTTNVAPDGSYAVSYVINGLLTSKARYDANGTQLTGTTFSYDAYGRQIAVTDARTGTATFAYDNRNQIVSVTTPAPASGKSTQVTTTIYDLRGRPVTVTQPDGTVIYKQYFANGGLQKTYGSRTYPVEYTYDYAGRMKTMKTWQNFAANSGSAVTTWNYDSQRGFLTTKRYADNKGPDYTYTAAGRLATRLWARGITTAYTYNNAGALYETSYDDGVTETIAAAYDRRGQKQAVIQGGITTSYLYNDAGQVLRESYSGGPLDGLSVTNTYDSLSRRTDLGVLNTSSLLTHTSYGYDAASRLLSVSDGTNSVAYSYLANSPLVSQITFTNNGSWRMTTTKSYDLLNRLTNIASFTASFTNSYTYQYNDANQRTKVEMADGSYWLYRYDRLGQVISGKKYWSDNTPVAGQQFEYGFDDIGNRQQVGEGGDETGGGLRQSVYSANNLNQYGLRTVPEAIDILGSANSNATVTVNSQRAYRKGEYFRKELLVNNSTQANLTNFSVLAVLNNGTNKDIVTTNTVQAMVVRNPEVYTYDDDGNLLTDGRWSYSWNAENNLIRMESSTNLIETQRVCKIWSYMPDGKWVQEIDGIYSGGSYIQMSTNKFVWDRTEPLLLLDDGNNVKVSTMRGIDLSSTIHGKGGADGILSVYISGVGRYFAGSDGIGSVVALVNSTNGQVGANYEYGPFGEAVRASGLVADVNPFRYASQYAESGTTGIKYLYRDYDWLGGKWLSRDPINEFGGRDLYSFCKNGPMNFVDAFGLFFTETTFDTSKLPVFPDHANLKDGFYPGANMFGGGVEGYLNMISPGGADAQCKKDCGGKYSSLTQTGSVGMPVLEGPKQTGVFTAKVDNGEKVFEGILVSPTTTITIIESDIYDLYNVSLKKWTCKCSCWNPFDTYWYYEYDPKATTGPTSVSVPKKQWSETLNGTVSIDAAEALKLFFKEVGGKIGAGD